MNEKILRVGVRNVAQNITKTKQNSFKQSKWIEMTDKRENRSLSKKFPLLNSYLFTKMDPAGEPQGQTMLGKLSTHEYHCTNKEYKNDDQVSGGQKLRNKILGFFKHYRSCEAKNKYKVLASAGFEQEFKQLEDHTKNYWSTKTCDKFSESVRTNKVESFFATRLSYVPKNINIKLSSRYLHS